MNLDFSSIKGTAQIVSAAALFSCATFFQARAATIELPLYGFQIDALDAVPDAASTTALQLCLPATEGFAPNINVQIQPYSGLIKDYDTLSKQQFGDMKWKVISECYRDVFNPVRFSHNHSPTDQLLATIDPAVSVPCASQKGLFEPLE